MSFVKRVVAVLHFMIAMGTLICILAVMSVILLPMVLVGMIRWRMLSGNVTTVTYKKDMD